MIVAVHLQTAHGFWTLQEERKLALVSLSNFAPPLKIGVILAIFSLSGNTPDSKERFINGVSSLEQGPAAALRILADQDRYLAK